MTRNEAVTMLVRLLGKEAEAKAGNWITPFDDVPAWAQPYVGYAYEHGLANGVASDKYGGSAYITKAQYLTFILRALGYSDTKGDFSWQSADEFAEQVMDISPCLHKDSFIRGDAALVSFDALDAALKGTNIKLLSHLCETGAAKRRAVINREFLELTVSTAEDAKNQIDYIAQKFGHYTLLSLKLADGVSEEEKENIRQATNGTAWERVSTGAVKSSVEAINYPLTKFEYYNYGQMEYPEAILVYEKYNILTQHGLADVSLSPLEYDTFDRVLEVYHSIFTDGMTDYQKVSAVTDWLVKNETYNDAVADNKADFITTRLAHNWYGGFVGNSIVCEAYAYAVSVLLNMAGVPCIYIDGYPKGYENVNPWETDREHQGHAWNKVYLDGAWYNLDVTWIDSSGLRSKFFLKSDKAFRSDGHEKYLYPNDSARMLAEEYCPALFDYSGWR